MQCEHRARHPAFSSEHENPSDRPLSSVLPWNRCEQIVGRASPKLAEASLATSRIPSALDGRKIANRAEMVAVDHSGILKVVARQTDGTFAGRLDKSWRDCERIRWRSSKARGYFGRNHW